MLGYQFTGIFLGTPVDGGILAFVKQQVMAHPTSEGGIKIDPFPRARSTNPNPAAAAVKIPSTLAKETFLLLCTADLCSFFREETVLFPEFFLRIFFMVMKDFEKEVTSGQSW